MQPLLSEINSQDNRSSSPGKEEGTNIFVPTAIFFRRDRTKVYSQTLSTSDSGHGNKLTPLNIDNNPTCDAVQKGMLETEEIIEEGKKA